MLILHTADLHLTSKEPSRLKVLEWLVNKVNRKKIDYIVIAGDLFDSNTDATILRPDVKKIFEKTKAEILIIPGNHDAESYGSNYDYGKNVRQILKKPYESLTVDDVKILAIPFQNTELSECIIDLSNNFDILIAHGTLYDLSILPILNDEDIEYMPIYPVDLENLCRCALLGHIHSSYIELNYKNIRAIYSGSPIALNTKCRTPRKIAIVRIDNKTIEIMPEEIEISPHWQNIEYFVFPGNEDKIISCIETEITKLINKNALLQIIVKGYISQSENEFKQRLNSLSEKNLPMFGSIIVDFDAIHSWDRVLKNPIVAKFVEKTSELPDELRMKIFEITFPHFSDFIK